MAIRFSNGFGIGASNNGGGLPYGNGPWEIRMSTTENYTMGIIFAGVPFSRNSAPGFASGWTNVQSVFNGGAALWEYQTFSSQEFSTPQNNILVSGDTSFDFTQVSDNTKGLTVIADALVGDGGFPVLSNSQNAQSSSTNSITTNYSLGAYEVLVLASGSETNRNGQTVSITSITGMNGIQWTRRALFIDNKSTCGQLAEIWYAVNNSASPINDSITVNYSGNFDDQGMIVTSWSNVNLTGIWTSGGPYTSNTNKNIPVPSPTPTPTPSPLPLTQPNNDGSSNNYGTILLLDGGVATSGNTILDQSGHGNDLTFNGTNPFVSSTYYDFNSGTWAQMIDSTVFNNLLNTMSITMWVNFPSIVANKSLFSRTQGGNPGWAFRAAPGLFNLVKYNVADQYSNGSFTYTTNTWYHIAIVQGGTSLTFMLNGVVVGALTSDSTNFASNNYPFYICKDTYDVSNIPLKLAKLKITDGFMTSSNVLNEFNSEKATYGY